jgi:hypothetical protein
MWKAHFNIRRVEVDGSFALLAPRLRGIERARTQRQFPLFRIPDELVAVLRRRIMRIAVRVECADLALEVEGAHVRRLDKAR